MGFRSTSESNRKHIPTLPSIALLPTIQVSDAAGRVKQACPSGAPGGLRLDRILDSGGACRLHRVIQGALVTHPSAENAGVPAASAPFPSRHRLQDKPCRLISSHTKTKLCPPNSNPPPPPALYPQRGVNLSGRRFVRRTPQIPRQTPSSTSF